MGQPTSGLGQRVNHTQLSEHMPLLTQRERGFGEHQFRMFIGAKLILVLLQSAVLLGSTHMFFRST
jgi:hypothetical protein